MSQPPREIENEATRPMVASPRATTIELPTPGELTAGDEIGGYRIDGKLAEGGMGIVYEAHHRFLARPVAIKVAHLPSPGGDAVRIHMRFLREAQLLGQLDHPGVVRVHDFGQLRDGRPWMAMDLLAGSTVAQLAAQERIAPGRAIGWLRQTAQVLGAAHALGAVHRDLKPDNLFVEAHDQVRVLDWGIALVRRDDDPRLTQHGLLLGTPTYIAPEQARGREVGTPADIYSLGVVAFELLAHRLPFEGPTVVDLTAAVLVDDPPALSVAWPDAPPALETLIAAMLAKNPAERPSADEVDRELAAVRLR